MPISQKKRIKKTGDDSVSLLAFPRQRTVPCLKKPVTIEEIESGVNNPKEPRGTYSALAIGMKLKDDKEILKVLKQYKTVNSLAKSNNQNRKQTTLQIQVRKHIGI